MKVNMVNSSYIETVVDNRYDVRRLEFLGQTGTVYINAISKGYFSKSYFSDYESLNLPYEVKSQMRVEIVNNVNL